MRWDHIQIDTDTWIVMREYPQQPTAVVHRVTSHKGEARYLLMTWRAEPSERRLVQICASLVEAVDQVPTVEPPHTPLHPGASVEQWEKWREAKAANEEKRSF